MSALHELTTAESIQTLQSSHNPYTLICFSATWCGPCKASKPTYEALANKYHSDPMVGLNCGIVYEHTLGEDIHQYQIRAFPTYVLYKGANEVGRVQGANFESIKGMIEKEGCKSDFGEGNTVGGGSGSENLSMEDARAQRLAMFDKKKKSNPEPEPMKTDEKVSANSKEEPMDVDNETKESSSAVPGDAAVGASTGTSTDAEMNDTATDEAATQNLIDPAENLSADDVETLTNSMGFTLIRAQKALINSSSGVEGAVEWLMNHQDDDDIDDPIPLVPKNSTTARNPLTEEEKSKKVADLKDLLKLRRQEREKLEQIADIDREKQRRGDGKESIKTKEEMDRLARKREVALRKKEKDDFRNERARIKRELEKDKMERRANKGKVASKLGIGGYNPDAIQYDKSDDKAGASEGGPPVQKKTKGSKAKIDEYISKVSSYKAGGDGGKCLKILLTYIKNICDNPGEEKFKRIKMDNKAYKTKIKPFVGAKVLLVAVGFAPDEGNEALVLANEADMDFLRETKEKLEKAYASY